MSSFPSTFQKRNLKGIVHQATEDEKRHNSFFQNRDLAEKAFGNVKERLNLRRTMVSSDVNLFKKYTLQGLLDELDVIECFEQKGHEARSGEMIKKQIELYGLLGIDPPSLQ